MHVYMGQCNLTSTILVQQIEDKNCALCGKSMKLGTDVYHAHLATMPSLWGAICN